MAATSSGRLLREVRACRLCVDDLPHGPRPVLQYHPGARILIAGQAPGRRVHAGGVPFADASGERLRSWMGIDEATFYTAQAVAILPMGFCYPGTGSSGDLPPLPRCADTWRQRLLAGFTGLRLTLVIGQYAQRWHLPEARASVTETVAGWRDLPPAVMALPHPSPRNNRWLKKNPWFERELLPELRGRVARALAGEAV
ncbi:MAG: uracil-DNA glycosylase family protein [Pseudomonadota bacterium]